MQTGLPQRSAASTSEDLRQCDRQIAQLVSQLQRDNEAIARMIADRQRRRRELLAAQERKLRALRDTDPGAETQTS